MNPIGDYCLDAVPQPPAIRLPFAQTGSILPVMFATGYVSTSVSLSDPTGSSVLVAAVSWLQGTLLGTVATTVAIIAVASVGLMMLAGRLNLRYGLTIIAGAFILFGASTIVAGIRSLTGGDFAGVPGGASPPVPPPPALPALPPANPDPYAGASMPPG
jgi:type IV secretion system protein VirB2